MRILFLPAEKFRKMLERNFFPDTTMQNIVIVTQFEKTTRVFIALYCTIIDPKGYLIKHLKLNKCMKPRDKSISDHQNRMEELMRYSTKLEGSRADLTEIEQKMILFNSFLVARQISYKWTQATVQASTVEQVMIYMDQEKEFAVLSW